MNRFAMEREVRNCIFVFLEDKILTVCGKSFAAPLPLTLVMEFLHLYVFLNTTVVKIFLQAVKHEQ